MHLRALATLRARVAEKAGRMASVYISVVRRMRSSTKIKAPLVLSSAAASGGLSISGKQTGIA